MVPWSCSLSLPRVLLARLLSRMGVNAGLQCCAPTGTDFSVGGDLRTDAAACQIDPTASTPADLEVMSYQFTDITVILW